MTYHEATRRLFVTDSVTITSEVISAHNTAIVNYFLKLVDASRTINTADHLASRWGNLIMIYYKFFEVLRILFVVRVLSSMLLAVTEKHVPRLVMMIHCLIIREE